VLLAWLFSKRVSCLDAFSMNYPEAELSGYRITRKLSSIEFYAVVYNSLLPLLDSEYISE